MLERERTKLWNQGYDDRMAQGKTSEPTWIGPDRWNDPIRWRAYGEGWQFASYSPALYIDDNDEEYIG